MNRQTAWICGLVAALGVLAGGCTSSSDEGGTTANIEVAGAVLAPGGSLAGVNPELAPVAGATVELIQVDGDGNQVGEVLATSQTSTTGNYTVVLPEGLSLSAMLMVRVTGVGGTLRGLVVSESVDITPTSEYVARKLTSGGNTLDNVSANEVLTISGHLEQFDFSVAATIDETIANLDAEAGPSLAPLLDLAQQPAGDAATIAGDYYFVQLGLTTGTFPQTFVFTDSGDLTIVDNGNGEGAITDISANESEAVQGAQPNGNGGVMYNLFTQFDLILEEPNVPLGVSADGSFTILERFEEEIFAPGEPGYPGGIRNPATATTLCPVANGLFAGVGYYEETVYDMTQDGTALDLTAPRGNGYEYNMVFAAKKGPVANSVLDGETYGVASIGEFMLAGGSRELFSDIGTIAFTAADATTGTGDGNFDPFSLNRGPLADSLGATVAWSMTGAGGVDDPAPDSDSEMIPYALDPATGALTFGAGTPDAEMGCLASGGEFFVLGLDLDGGDPIVEACRGILFGIKLGVANPDVSNKTYKVLLLEKGVETNGSSYIGRLLGGSITLNGNATVTGTSANLSRDNDLGDGASTETSPVDEQGTFGFTGNNGRLMIDLGGPVLDGWMSANGSVGALRVHASDIAGNGQASLGLVILIQQP